ncbi:AraC family transcriptional regulator [Niastella koreensis]|uniref:Transcriptional regulator, AraC family n=2 Tax=Niastella koreensis TaxID=354356 RepID=G8TCP6_NIAKG|nr:AraC family transcriptional regulator [Niastella koreensis]AEW03500.1 transcriptional regulator, AraC family [Niastella koreensis GR20-10]OQP53860.1 AraC family transcriptional regulator [Niastella koreensis]
MDADIHTLYESDFYRIMDFRCRCTDCRTSKPEYNATFCISFVRKGNFLFNVFRRSLDSYTGCVLVTKPNYERTVTHTHDVPDECTIFEFKKDFFGSLLEHYGGIPFFQDNDWHSTLIKTSAETEFLHFHIVKLVLTRSGSKLQIDNAVIEVIEKVLSNITDYKPDLKINPRLKKNHLITLERAKEYMADHFTEDISLLQIATHCYVSPFHFSRLFKTFTSASPHQYLLTLRLKNAELLLRNTTQPMADVAFTSGFNSVEHFTAAFKQKYNCPPATYRQQVEAPTLK